MTITRIGFFALATLAAAALTACGATKHLGHALAPQAATYTAKIHPINSKVAGTEAHGVAKLRVRGEKLIINVDMAGLPPNMVHWQHFHGFEVGTAATCPTAAQDTNGDGIVDLIETEPVSGTTMVPFNNAPAEMDVPNGIYPASSSNGTYSYRQEVNLKDLQTAFGKVFNGKKLDLGERVIYIHGVPENTKLPTSVKSLGPIPAHVTLPIACGTFIQQ